MPQPKTEAYEGQRKFILRADPSEQGGAPSSFDKEARTVRLTLATETPVREWTPYGYADEVLLMDGVVLPSGGQCPLLDSHNAYSLNGQLGSLRGFSIVADRLDATAHFSVTAEKAFTLVEEGHLKDASVRAKILEHVFIPEGTTQTIAGKSFTGPIVIATRWEVKEGSFTPIGADKNAKTRAASDGQNREEDPMSVKKDQGRAEGTGNAPEIPASQTTPAAASASDAARADTPPPLPAAAPGGPTVESVRAEIVDIMTVGRMHGCMELAEQAVRNGTSLNEFRGMVLADLSNRSAANAPSHMPHVEMGRTGGEKFRAAMSDAMCLRSGAHFTPKDLAPGAEEFRGYSLMESARESLRAAGLPIPSDPMEMIGRAFTETSSDFPNILADTANKSLIAGAQEAEETYEAWTGETTANNFQVQTGVNIDAFSTLEVVPDGAEYTSGTLNDRGIRYAVATYGKLFGITRQTIINDNVSAFTQIPAAMGRAAMRARGNAVYSLLTGNPQMPDGNALFSAAHNNLAASGGKITVDAYTAAVTAMGTHKGKQGEVLNIMPKFMLVPVARTAEARILMGSQYIGTQATPTQLNPWQGDVTVVVDGRLDAASGLPWFLAAAKGLTINVAYLFGNKAMRLEQRQGFTVDGVEFKVSSDFGAYVQDWNGLYKNPGA